MKNKSGIAAQLKRIQTTAQRELLNDWRQRRNVLADRPKRVVYAVGSAITNLFPSRRPDLIHNNVATRSMIDRQLEEIANIYEARTRVKCYRFTKN